MLLSFALRVLVFFVSGVKVFVHVFAIFCELLLDFVVGVAQVVLQLIFELFDHLIELFNTGGRQDFGEIEGAGHDVGVRKAIGRNDFFLLVLLFLLLVALCGFFLISLLLLGLDELNSLFLGPCTLFKLFVDIDLFLYVAVGSAGVAGV